MKKEYDRVREEFEIVAKMGSGACLKSAMLNVDALVEAVRKEAAQAKDSTATASTTGASTRFILRVLSVCFRWRNMFPMK